MKIKVMIGTLVILTVAFVFILVSPSAAGLKSDLILQLQGKTYQANSVFNQVGLALEIPTSKDVKESGWTSHMKLYHPGQNFPHDGGNGEMSIIYNFGQFENGCSTFYDPDSDYFNAHYGVYAIHLEQGIFGWKNGQLDVEAIKRIVMFDQLDLVMASLGCPVLQRTFECEITDIKDGPVMAGFSDWIQMDASIKTNSPLHHQTGNHLGYIQYGEPPKNYQGEDFPVISTRGRLYLRYDETRKVTIIYFVIGATQAFIDQTSEDYLMPIQWRAF